MNSLSPPFRVLFVCTGNICRSAITEQVARSRYGHTHGVEFASAGVGALVGESMPAEAADISRRLGGFPDDHLARQLGPAEVRDADLVIALAREHRSEVVRSMPRASRYTFTLREFARLLESAVDDPQMQFAAFAPGSETSAWLRAAVPQIAARRGFAELPVEPEHDDVIDPYRQEQSVYDLSAAQIEDAMDRIQRAIRRLVPRLP